MKQVRIRKRVFTTGALVLALSLVVAGAAFADNLHSDGDGVVPFENNDLAFGTVCVDSETVRRVPIWVSRQGSGVNVFKNGATVAVGASFTEPHATLAVAMDDEADSLTVHDTWVGLANNSVSHKSLNEAGNQTGVADHTRPAGVAWAEVTLTAPADPGALPIGGDAPTILFEGTGSNTSDNEITRDDKMTVSATFSNTGDCAPSGDETPPTITITTPEDGDVYLLGEEVLADYFCEDEVDGSGLASCEGNVENGDPIDTSTVGAKTFTVDAEDNAGNEASLTHDYSVIYDFDGFFRPINMGIWNSAKAGSSIPVKFSLDGDQGLGIFAAAFPKVTQINCDTGETDPVEPDEVTDPSMSKPGLHYDEEAGQYVYVWKTQKSWSGSCRRLAVKFVDGEKYTADFKFTK